MKETSREMDEKSENRKIGDERDIKRDGRKIGKSKDRR